MVFCTKCGQGFDENLSACPNCGAENKAKANAASGFNANDLYNMAFNTEDTTSSVDAGDIKNNMLISLLAYIGPLALIPFFCAKDSKFARYHAVRGLNLFIIELALGIICALVGGIPVLGWIVSTIVGLICLVFMIIGIANVIQGRCRELPFIGGFKIIK